MASETEPLTTPTDNMHMKLGEHAPAAYRTPTIVAAAMAAAAIAFAIAITAVAFAGVTYTDFKNIRSNVDSNSNGIKTLSQLQQNALQELETLNTTIYYIINNFNSTSQVNVTIIVGEVLVAINSTLAMIQAELANVTYFVDLARDYSIASESSAIQSQHYANESNLAAEMCSLHLSETIDYYTLTYGLYNSTLGINGEALTYSVLSYNYSQDSLGYSEVAEVSSLTSAIHANESLVQAQISEFYANQSMMQAQISEFYANLSMFYLNGTIVYWEESGMYANDSLMYYLMAAVSYNQSFVLFENMQDLFMNFNATIDYIIHSGILNGNLSNATSALLIEGIQAANVSLQYMLATEQYLLQVQEIWMYIQENETQVLQYLLEVEALADQVQANASLVFGYLQEVLDLLGQVEGNVSLAQNYSIDSMIHANYSQYYSDLAEYYYMQTYNISTILGLQTNGTLIFDGIRIGGAQIVFVQEHETIVQAISPAMDVTIFIPDPESTNSSFVLTSSYQLITGDKEFMYPPIITNFTGNGVVMSGSDGRLSEELLTNGQLIVGSTGTYPIKTTLTGTPNQVIVTNGAGSITLSLPQNLATTSVPSFQSITLTGIATGSTRFIYLDDNNNIKFYTPTTGGQILIGCMTCGTQDGVNMGSITSPDSTVNIGFAAGPPSQITVQLPQDISTTSNVTFNNIILTDQSTSESAFIYIQETGMLASLTPADGEFLVGRASAPTAANKIGRGIIQSTDSTVNVQFFGLAIPPSYYDITLPQSIATTASPTFQNLTLQNAVITGSLTVDSVSATGNVIANNVVAEATVIAPLIAASANISASGYIQATQGIRIGPSTNSFITSFNFGTVSATCNSGGTPVSVTLSYMTINQVATIWVPSFNIVTGGGQLGIVLPTELTSASSDAGRVWGTITISGVGIIYSEALVASSVLQINVVFSIDDFGMVTFAGPDSGQTLTVNPFSITYLTAPIT